MKFQVSDVVYDIYRNNKFYIEALTVVESKIVGFAGNSDVWLDARTNGIFEKRDIWYYGTSDSTPVKFWLKEDELRKEL